MMTLCKALPPSRSPLVSFAPPSPGGLHILKRTYSNERWAGRQETKVRREKCRENPINASLACPAVWPQVGLRRAVDGDKTRRELDCSKQNAIHRQFRSGRPLQVAPIDAAHSGMQASRPSLPEN
jgi:hypothetical protein